jgi:hypothetical protein
VCVAHPFFCSVVVVVVVVVWRWMLYPAAPPHSLVTTHAHTHTLHPHSHQHFTLTLIDLRRCSLFPTTSSFHRPRSLLCLSLSAFACSFYHQPHRRSLTHDTHTPSGASRSVRQQHSHSFNNTSTNRRSFSKPLRPIIIALVGSDITLIICFSHSLDNFQRSSSSFFKSHLHCPLVNHSTNFNRLRRSTGSKLRLVKELDISDLQSHLETLQKRCRV